MLALLGFTGSVLVAAGAGLICGVLFNAPIRAVLQKIPLVGKYF